MNILLITLGSRGDINPFVSLGIALKNRGHVVTVITSDIYKQLITSIGLNFISCSTTDDYVEIINNPDFYNPKKSFQSIVRYMLLEPMRLLYRIIADFDPENTILVATRFMIGARLANEKLNFPLASVCLLTCPVF